MSSIKNKILIVFLTLVLIVLSLCLSFTIVSFILDKVSFKVTNYNVSYNGLTANIYSDNGIRNASGKISLKSEEILNSLKGLTIVQISDFHNEEYGKDNMDFLNTIDEINPDIVLFTGDVVNVEDRKYEKVFHIFEYLGNKYECYIITGNHERGLPEEYRDKIIKKAKECNIVFIENEGVQIKPYVYLYGLNYDKMYYYKKNDYPVSEMQKALGMPDDNYFNILITHDPNSFDTYSNWGADLVFAGHTHGGMIRIFDRGLISTDRDLLPKYDGGIFNDNDGNSDYNAMIVSKGLSEGHIGFRLYNMPELVVVKF